MKCQLAGEGVFERVLVANVGGEDAGLEIRGREEGQEVVELNSAAAKCLKCSSAVQMAIWVAVCAVFPCVERGGGGRMRSKYFVPSDVSAGVDPLTGVENGRGKPRRTAFQGLAFGG